MLNNVSVKPLLAASLCALGLSFHALAADVAIVIHGGAGTILKKNMTPEREKAYVEKLTEAVKKGYALLQSGVDGETAVVETIQVLEQSPLFNAGIGAVYTFDGEHELDASMMHGGTLNAGAVAGVKTIASPIAAAQAVMEHSPHVMLSGKGAEEFALSRGMEPVDNHIFDTERRYKALEKARERILKADIAYGGQQGNERFGTVGAVVI
ncbi:MAG: isoaspartyl peptidase/L-asparaginase, partial [Pseudomonadota bacterium]|nr:isoaspartyl peptidase/L-asparaginase [Pseudomonadota bacterium]